MKHVLRQALAPVFLLALSSAACRSVEALEPVPMIESGQSIRVCGQLVPIGVPVILWDDPDGFDAYAANGDDAELSYQPGRLSRDGQRRVLVAADTQDPSDLGQVVDQFILHYDVAGSSERCFRILQKRGLSVHFLLDIDGTLYQTLDLREQAWHATKSNPRSIGIEIAQLGARSAKTIAELDDWYAQDARGTHLTAPNWAKGEGPLAQGFVGRPAREGLIEGRIHGERLLQYDFTPEQYQTLAHLTAGLCLTFPRMAPDTAREENGQVATRKLTDEEFAAFGGVLGHFHVQRNKVDPGPAFQWDVFLEQVRRLSIHQRP